MSEEPGSRSEGAEGGFRKSGFADKTVFHLLLIAAVGLLAYSNTFEVPFQWDKKFLPENPIIKDLGYFLEPGRAEGLELYSTFKRRYMGYLTFAVNYRIHGLDVTGYHVLNILIHISNALFLYAIALLTFKTPLLKDSSLRGHSGRIALLAGVLFVSHPVQTEAVTYIFQRLASLCAFFYLLCVLSYARSRLSGGAPGRYGFYALSLLSAVLAMKTKENAFTLPFAIALYEVFFLSGPLRKRLLWLIPVFSTLIIIPMGIIYAQKPPEGPESLAYFSGMGYKGISSWDYLLTQFRVVVTYIRALFLPVNQNIDYDYPVYRSLFEAPVLLSLLFHLSAVGLAVLLFFRAKAESPPLGPVSFGILWFYLALSVESSVIPIPMLINEYRVYLPSAGVFISASTAAFLLYERLGRGKARLAAVFLFVSVPLVFSFAAYKRNSLWQTEVGLWKDTARKSPNKERVRNNLGLAYSAEGKYDMAIEEFLTAMLLKPGYINAHNNIAIAYEAKGMHEEAIEHYLFVVGQRPESAEAHFNLATAYKAYGLSEKAIEHYRTSLGLKPDFAEAHNNLGAALIEKGDLEGAAGHFISALRIRPGFSEARNNLNFLYGLIEKQKR